MIKLVLPFEKGSLKTRLDSTDYVYHVVKTVTVSFQGHFKI